MIWAEAADERTSSATSATAKRIARLPSHNEVQLAETQTREYVKREFVNEGEIAFHVFTFHEAIYRAWRVRRYNNSEMRCSSSACSIPLISKVFRDCACPLTIWI